MPASSRKGRIIVVDDEPLLLESWNELLGSRYDVALFSDGLAAQRQLESDEFDVALLDIRMPGADGMALLSRIKQRQPLCEVIMVTGHATVQMAVQAIQLGAYDFFCKPIEDLDAAMRRIGTAVEKKLLRELNATLSSRLDALVPSTTLVGDSRAIVRIRELIGQIADAAAPVLICGESGTGKELAARGVHSQGKRKDQPFVAVNCAAISENLIDSELFGHERGAFTGAMSSHEGLFEAADGGVLFLDEIGDVPPQTQVRLLRALQDGEVRAVGSTKSRRVDVRVIAATNVDLERAMRQGRFREDLYYRISTFRIDVPPLRERRDDIPLLSQHLLAKVASKAGRKVRGFSDEALAVLLAYPWPGNVRELTNVLEHAITLCRGDLVDVSHLPSFVSAHVASQPQRGAPVGSISSAPFSAARSHLLDEFEVRYLTDLLAATDGNLSEAARRSGIDRSNLRRMLKRHNLNAVGFRAMVEDN